MNEHETNTKARPVIIEPSASAPTENPRADERAFAQRALRAEAEAVLRLADHLPPSFHDAVDLIVTRKNSGGNLVVAGMGKSGVIGQKISATIASLGVPSHWVHPADAVHGDLGRIRRDDTLLALSYSGATPEVVALASILRQDNLPIITITAGRGDSPLERLATVSLGIGVVEEACPLALAPTTSTTATLALGDALALAASRRLAFSPDDFAKRHPGGLLGDLLRPITDILRFTVGDNLPVVRENLSVQQALESASGPRRPGALVIVDDSNRLVGLFTDGDLRRLVLENPAHLSKPISDVMTRSPRALPAAAVVRDAVQMVREHRADEIPVVDEQRHPVGILDVQDLVALKLIQN